MKLESIKNNSNNTIRSYDNNCIKVNDDIYTQSFIITSDQLIPRWRPENFSDLCLKDLELITDLDPEIIILGSGNHLHFPESSITAIVTSKNIGFEVMDTYAACRCYSLLLSEGRNVAAGLILEKSI